MLGCGPGQLTLPLSRRSQLGAVATRLLEMVGQDLLVLGRAVRARPGEPGGVPLVQVGPDLLRDGGVGGVADQPVREAKAVVAGERGLVGSDQLLADERHQVGGQRAAGLFRQELRDRTPVEAPALDGTALDHRPLAGLEAVDACRQQRLDRGRDRQPVAGLVEPVGEHLLDEERVPLRARDDPGALRRGQRLPAGKPPD